MAKKKIEVMPYDGTEFLDTEEARAEYLNLELANGDPYYIQRALNNIARSREKSALSKKAGVPRMTLYRALSKNGNPEYATIQKIVDALDMQLVVIPKGAKIAICG